MGVANAGFSWSQVLTFLQELAEMLGRGLVRLFDLILPAGRGVHPQLVMPLGYLALLTLLLLLFNLIAAARKVIWFVVGIGWLLLLVRILLDAFAG
ncbi:MAG: hypothetical protein ACK42E_05200 [Candidatus Bipolaricaulaceae bacterium]